MSNLPERINAMKVITYSVPEIVESLESMGMEDIDLDVIVEYIQEWIYEDFGDNDVILQDENGNEL